jgi:predicted secreted protein with PEFG-CTERM motif
MPGSSYSVTLDEAGEYPYFCMVHPWMEGLVIVEDSHAAEEEAAAAEAAEAEAEAAAEAAAEQMTLSADDIVISVPESADANEVVAIDVTIGDSHVTYDIVATHNGETILDESGVHVHTGEGSHTTSALTAPASDDNPIDVTVTFQGFGMPGDDMTGPIGLTSTAQVVPEFGTIAALILVVAIASIIAITAKSKVSLMPKL